jgi:preprotein translocase, SecY subunit
MLELFRNMWRVKDLRNKIFYTLGMLLLFRLVSVVPAPGVDAAKALAGGLRDLPMLEMMDMMTGGNFTNMTIMAMGITPYINASIIMQLLTIAIPALENLQKQGEEGKKKINRITRYVTIGLAVVQAIGLVASLGYVRDGWYNAALVGISMAGGTALALWIGERITQKGVGNGISLLIFAGIVNNIFNGVVLGVSGAVAGTGTWLAPVVTLLLLIILVVVVTFVDKGERRFNVHYAKRVVGNKMMGGQSTQFPIKVNSSGVLPLIFAYSFIAFPGTIIQLVAPNSGVAEWWKLNMTGTGTLNMIITFLLIIGFTYFYSSIGINYRDVAKNITKNGGTITGVRGGKQTADVLIRSSHRLTLFTALFLGVLSTIPGFMYSALKVSIPFAASSMLIAVSVALETTRQIEYELVRHHHKGITR